MRRVGSAWLGTGAISAVLTMTLTSSRLAFAGGPLGDNGQPITTSRYAVDFFQGPVYSGARVVGLGGAYVAVAEDVDGNLQNPATPAVRPFYSTDYFDYWLGFAVSFPVSLENMDFFNSGEVTAVSSSQEEFVFATPALNLQWGTFGLGATFALQHYVVQDATFETDEGKASLAISVNDGHIQAANAFLDGQLMVGLGLRLLTQSVDAKTENLSKQIFVTTGSGLEGGVLYRPNRQPFRVGASVRSGVETAPKFSRELLPDSNGDITIPRGDDVIYLPERVSTPWDFDIGVAYQFGRTFNPVWRSSEDMAERAAIHHRLRQLDREDERQRRLAEATSDRERAQITQELDEAQAQDDERLEQAVLNAARLTRFRNAQMRSFYLLLSSSLVISGAAREAVGVDSFLNQEVNRSGERVVYSPRFGAESEVWPHLLRVRTGSYLEPTRFETSSPRLHGTGGFDVRLIRWRVFGLWPDDYLWRLTASIDVSERYLVWGLSVGGWYPRWAPPPF